jgi:hypothetical protein
MIRGIADCSVHAFTFRRAAMFTPRHARANLLLTIVLKQTMRACIVPDVLSEISYWRVLSRER